MDVEGESPDVSVSKKRRIASLTIAYRRANVLMKNSNDEHVAECNASQWKKSTDISVLKCWIHCLWVNVVKTSARTCESLECMSGTRVRPAVR